MHTLELPQYRIHIGAGSLDVLAQELAQWQPSRIAVLVDENTGLHCWPLLAAVLPAVPAVIKIPAGETHKTLDTCQYIWSQMMALGLDRQSLLINLGGGVIGDMGGFCASTFKRGMRFVQVPTTLLSQVDASIGGKLGIDFGGIKNSVGVFQDPQGVYIDTRFLDTLPHRELRSGYAEVFKHALIADAEAWADLSQLSDLSHGISDTRLLTSLSVKQGIVNDDPYERGIRKALNFGHTIGHALESHFLATDAPLLHGEAIAIGMICEAYLSQQLAGLSANAVDAITSVLLRHYGWVDLPLSAVGAWLESMQQDKKNESDAINFTLLKAIGEASINHTASPALIQESLVFYQQCQP